MGFPEVLKELRTAKKMTQESAAKNLGIARTTYASYEQGLRAPDYEGLQKIADYFYVSIDYLLGYSSEKERTVLSALSEYAFKIGMEDITIKDLVEHMRVNNPEDYQDYTKLIERSEQNSHQIKEFVPERMSRIPVLGTIRAGQPIDRIENIEEYTLVDPDTLRGREGFALRITGNSMSGDRIQEGDIVIVVKQEEVTHSDIAVVAVNGDYATLKRVKRAGDMCMLIPSNPTMQPELVPCKDVHILGKVVEVKFSIK